MVNLEAVGIYIAKLRTDKSFTQAQLADLVGVSHQAVSKWETGSGLPDVEILLKLGSIFGITVEELMNPPSESVDGRPENLSYQPPSQGAIAPSGTVTFLFTDIEGSTQLWEQHPETMKVALERHDALLHAAIADVAARRALMHLTKSFDRDSRQQQSTGTEQP